ncbi:glycoside hydrolase family 2 TIM barrel-domain containing protein [uncultured Pseudokineococcus sp.]|uniref:glycoside hydrolase family 2 TIM barrel-domain containing protein n=1 Tax=uncultured Pseudokineococcus sp. TaxID=1642928 RepID=UPI00260B6A95|nr:glycoside hydrolase family 2 TIM barrel-domain containing protein [uncultured Pseudokineococcus sp.]
MSERTSLPALRRARVRRPSTLVPLALGAGLVAGLVPGAPATAAEPTPWSGTPGVFQEGRLPATARTVPLTSAGAALQAPDLLTAEERSRWMRSLDGTWAFRWSPSADAAPEGFEAPGYDDRGWDRVSVPHDWQIDGYGEPGTGDVVYLNQEHPWQGYGHIAPPQTPTQGASVATYRRDVLVPGRWEGRRSVLAFQGVKSAFTVWVNGERVGYSEDSYAPAEFDVTDALHRGRNTVAVEVHRWSDGSWLEDQDMIDLSGIFRSVELYSTPLVHLDDQAVRTDLDEDLDDAVLAVDARVTAAPGAAAAGTRLRSTLHGPDDRTVATTTTDVEVAAGGAADVAVAMDVDSPALWTAETPTLYTLVHELLDARGRVVETTATRVGFREFGVVDGVMTLNGQKLDIKGVNRGEMHPDTGQALTLDQMREDLVLMRQHGITAVRTSHYPAHPALYSLADEIGLYVMDEANLETHDMRPFPGNAPDWYDAVFDRVRSMYERDKNHPSVLWWSMGNEVGSGPVFQDMAAWLKEEDPGRLLHFQQDNSLADVDGFFYPPLSQLQQRVDRGGDKPWIMSEYEHSMGNSTGNVAEYWELVDSDPELQGGFIWDWADQAVRLPVDGGVDALPVEPGTPEEETYFSYGGDWGDYATDGWFEVNGLVLPDRTVQPELLDVAAVYAPVEVVEEDLAADAGPRVRLRNEHVATDLSELDATWVLREDDEVVGTGDLDVALAPGAEGWVDLPVAAPQDPPPGAQYWLTVSFALPEATAWAPAGHEVASTQLRMPWTAPPAPDLLATGSGSEEGELAVADDEAQVQVAGDGFTVAVDKATGTMTSFTHEGRELLEQGPVPDFWRAPTQNDVENGLASRAAPWRDAGADREVTSVDVRRAGDGAVQVQVEGTLPTPSRPQFRLGYLVLASGDVVVRSTSAAEPALSEVPAVGTVMDLPADLDQLTWYGRGEHETWTDRHDGAHVGRWSGDVADQFFPQVVPQATGNHTGVRWASLTDAAGAGLMVSGEDLEVTALHQGEAAIEAAAHPFEVAADDVVHLTVDGRQTGLGNSWTDTALPQYTVSADEPRSVSYVLRGVGPGDDRTALSRRSVDLDLLADLRVDGQTVAGFHPDVTDYVLTSSSALAGDAPVVEAVPASDDVDVSVEQAAGRPGVAVVTARGADGLLETTYEVRFEVVDELPLSDVGWESAVVGYGTPGRDVTIEGQPIQLLTEDGVTTFAKGLGVHAEARIEYDLEPWDFDTFTSLVGVEQHAARDGRRFVFAVELDGQEVWTSPVMTRGTPAVPVEVALGDATELALVLRTAGDGIGHGHGAWGDPLLS